MFRAIAPVALALTAAGTTSAGSIVEPFIETFEEARHFKLGPGVYEGGIYPWREPIRSDQRLDAQSIAEIPSNVPRT